MGGASKYLSDLPARGLLSSDLLFTNPGRMRVYVCDHETSPPEEQLIKTNTTNILIRSLQLNKQRSESKDTKSRAANGVNRNKRPAEKPLEGKMSTRRASKTIDSEGTTSFPSDKELQAFTVERLRALLKEKGLSVKGKKDELILRLKDDES